MAIVTRMTLALLMLALAITSSWSLAMNDADASPSDVVDATPVQKQHALKRRREYRMHTRGQTWSSNLLARKRRLTDYGVIKALERKQRRLENQIRILQELLGELPGYQAW